VASLLAQGNGGPADRVSAGCKSVPEGREDLRLVVLIQLHSGRDATPFGAADGNVYPPKRLRELQGGPFRDRSAGFRCRRDKTRRCHGLASDGYHQEQAKDDRFTGFLHEAFSHSRPACPMMETLGLFTCFPQ